MMMVAVGMSAAIGTLIIHVIKKKMSIGTAAIGYSIVEGVALIHHGSIVVIIIGPAGTAIHVGQTGIQALHRPIPIEPGNQGGDRLRPYKADNPCRFENGNHESPIEFPGRGPVDHIDTGVGLCGCAIDWSRS